MNEREKELRQQKLRAQLDEWQAEVDKLRAQATGAGADARLSLSERIEALQHKIAEGKTQLEAAWDAAKDALGEAFDKTKE